MTMRTLRLIVTSLCLSLTTSSAFAVTQKGARTFGLGLVLGDPSAITLKSWHDNRQAIQGGLAFALDNYVLVYGDYLYHFPSAFGKRDKFASELVPYVGVGGILAFTIKERSDEYRYFGKNSGSVGLGTRVPLGIEWKPAHPPLGAFLELTPGLAVIPATRAYLQGGIGIRYYF